MRDEFRHGIDQLSETSSFTVSTAGVTGVGPIGGYRRFEDCHVESVPQLGGRKPHIAVKDNYGVTVFEVGARSVNAYAALSGMLGKRVDWFSWNEEPSYGGDGTFLRCRFKNSDRAIAAGPPLGRIILDTETTGLHPRTDEILQLSIIDGNGQILLNRFYKPEAQMIWPEAQGIHGISPAAVANCPPVRAELPLIQQILDHAQEVCVYNAEFDLAFLGELGLKLDMEKVRDTMREYGQAYHGTPYYKLEKAAAECGYRYRAHDALADCFATLRVQNKIDGPAGRFTPRPMQTPTVTVSMPTVAPRARKTSPYQPRPARSAPLSRSTYTVFRVLLGVLVAVDAILVATCIAQPLMIVIVIPAIAFTVFAFKWVSEAAPHDSSEIP